VVNTLSLERFHCIRVLYNNHTVIVIMNILFKNFLALNDACLVMDRRLVINTAHETNDPLIFAAGPLTKYSRHYRAEQW